MTSFSTNTKEIRKFGIIAILFFGNLSILSIWLQKKLAICFFGFLFLLGLCFLILPDHFRPVYNGWLKIAHMISTVITIFILSLAYYLVITPATLLKRIFGGRPIHIKPDKKLSTYWVKRLEPLQSKERFKKRF